MDIDFTATINDVISNEWSFSSNGNLFEGDYMTCHTKINFQSVGPDPLGQSKLNSIAQGVQFLNSYSLLSSTSSSTIVDLPLCRSTTILEQSFFVVTFTYGENNS